MSSSTEDTSSSDKKEEKKSGGVNIFTIRVPVSPHDYVTLMDEAVDDSLVIKSRNTWIVNAIHEQLKREGRLKK